MIYRTQTEENRMGAANWVDWNQTELEAKEREELLGALTPEQSRRLLQNDYLWVERVGVLWRPQDRNPPAQALHAQRAVPDPPRGLPDGLRGLRARVEPHGGAARDPRRLSF